jgi:adenosine deaminase
VEKQKQQDLELKKKIEEQRNKILFDDHLEMSERADLLFPQKQTGIYERNREEKEAGRGTTSESNFTLNKYPSRGEVKQTNLRT